MNETPRPEIAALRSSTLCEAFQITAAQRPEQVALFTQTAATEITYAEFLAQVRALAEGLHSLGVGRCDTVALMLANRPEFSLADTAVMHLGATAFSVYNSSSAEQAQHVFRNAGNRVVVTERQFLPRVLESRTPVKSFPLNDQEILCRHIHKTAQEYVRRYQQSGVNGRS